MLTRGVAAARNMEMIPSRQTIVGPAWLVVHLALPLCVFVGIGMWALLPARDSLEYSTLSLDALHLTMALVFHRTAIAIKYAYMSPRDYCRAMSRTLTAAEKAANQLVTGWLAPSPRVVAREVRAAAQRVEATEAGVFNGSADEEEGVVFSLTCKSLAALHADLCRDGQLALAGRVREGGGGDVEGDGSGGLLPYTPLLDPAATPAASSVVTVRPVDLATALIVQSVHAGAVGNRHMIAATVVVSAAVSLAPTVLRVALGIPPLGSEWRAQLLVCCHFAANAFGLTALYAFLVVGIADNSRRKRALEYLGRLLACGGTPLIRLQPSASGLRPCTAEAGDVPSDTIAGDEPLSGGGGDGTAAPHSSSMGVLPLDSLPQLRAFLLTRHLLLHAGSGYHARLVLVESLALAISGGMGALAVLRMLLAVDEVDSVLTYFVLFHALVAPVFGWAALGLAAAVSANEAAGDHVELLARARLRVRFTAATREEGTPKDHASYLARILKDAREAVEQQMRVAPLRVLGFVASPELMQAFLGAWLSLETASISVLLSRMGILG
jgi:hypothetical protein